MSLDDVLELYDVFYVKTDNLVCLDTIDSGCRPDNIENALADLNINENYRMIHLVSVPTGEYYSVVLGAESTFVFLYMDEGGQKDLFFQSLTSMFQTISASYQEGAYIVREGEDLELEPELFKSVWERYNPLLAQGPSSAIVDEYIKAQVEAQNEDDELGI
ncbi:MAG: hypothetical protein F6K30_27825 [Cyanothece sp. SIO2G6]|nr:hypothetical protein [Cyanothece sp. SIO2G6]